MCSPSPPRSLARKCEREEKKRKLINSSVALYARVSFSSLPAIICFQDPQILALVYVGFVVAISGRYRMEFACSLTGTELSPTLLRCYCVWLFWDMAELSPPSWHIISQKYLSASLETSASKIPISYPHPRKKLNKSKKYTKLWILSFICWENIINYFSILMSCIQVVKTAFTLFDWK